MQEGHRQDITGIQKYRGTLKNQLRAGSITAKEQSVGRWPARLYSVRLFAWGTRGIDSKLFSVLSFWSICKLHEVVERGLVANLGICIVRVFVIWMCRHSLDHHDYAPFGDEFINPTRPPLRESFARLDYSQGVI